MSLNLNWGDCPNSERLDSDNERNVSFVCGIVMMHAGIGRVTEETINELVGWSALLNLECGGLLMDSNGSRDITPEEWLARLGMGGNIVTDSPTKRKTNLMKRLTYLGQDRVRWARKNMEVEA